ncbi:MAG TPA: glycosyltransferase [Acidimicrobiia bacterium]|nr:glycosyltransferase [Acidimicrobiia bacterium]
MFALTDAPTLRRVGMVSTYPPTRCGIARFADRLVTGLTALVPDVEIDVVRLIDGQGLPAIGKVRAEFDPDSPVGIRMAARILNRADGVILQHEYGLFGDNDGEAVVDLVGSIHRPTVTILHTVLADPSPRQRRIVQELHAESSLVVLCGMAREALEEGYGIPAQEVSVVHHGSDWMPQPVNPAPRRRLISWGLLGPGKGLERGVRSIAELQDLVPQPHYTIVGRTHPNVLRREGTAYRDSLQQLVSELDIGHLVTFIDRYVEEEELLTMVKDSDVVLVPYDNQEQMASGVVTDALAAGRPVVATRFPYAVEMLSDGSGITVGHGASEVASAIHGLFVDEARYDAATGAAARRSRTLAWTACAKDIVELVHRTASKARLEVR